MAKADLHKVYSVDKDKLFEVITKYEDYPKFVEGCRGAEVRSREDGHARVHYDINMMKDVKYVLDHRADAAAGEMSWDLVEADIMKKNSGRWKLTPAGEGKTDVHYEVEVEFTIPVPGFVLNKLIKSTLPKLVESFIKRAGGRD